MTEKLYQKLVAQISERLPNHALLATLQRGFSPLNVAYLKAIKIPFEISDITEKKSEKVENPLEKWRIERAKLFVERAKLSNRFTEKPLTEEHILFRQGISDQIKEVQKRISKTKKLIRYYEVNGFLPPDLAPEAQNLETKHPIPASPLEREKKLQTVRSQIIYRQKSLLNDTISDKKKKELQTELSDFELYKTLLEDAIKIADGREIKPRKRE